MIVEEASVSRTADRLGVTQSAVSYSLAKLRNILGGPLFVRSGQGLTPTEKAISLRDSAIHLLDGLNALTHQRAFDPKCEQLHFLVAANDMQRDLVFPALHRNSKAQGIKLTLEFFPSGRPSFALLRDARCDLILTPQPPDAPSTIQQRLFTGRMICFFDATQRDAPITVEEYVAADHVSVRFPEGGASNDVLIAPDVHGLPEAQIIVPNFSAIPPFVRQTRSLATQLEFMHKSSLSGLDMAPLPFASEPVSIYMVWHERATNEPAHRWLRQAVLDITRGLK